MSYFTGLFMNFQKTIPPKLTLMVQQGLLAPQTLLVGLLVAKINCMLSITIILESMNSNNLISLTTVITWQTGLDFRGIILKIFFLTSTKTMNPFKTKNMNTIDCPLLSSKTDGIYHTRLIRNAHTGQNESLDFRACCKFHYWVIIHGSLTMIHVHV